MFDSINDILDFSNIIFIFFIKNLRFLSFSFSYYYYINKNLLNGNRERINKNTMYSIRNRYMNIFKFKKKKKL